MRRVEDYLEISPHQARAQWRSILNRPRRPEGVRFRQVDFTPVETVLCLAAMLVVDHHRFGGRTNRSAPTPVPELASLFERTSASILAKQANLDGSRANGAQFEVEAAATLLGETPRLVGDYLVIIAGARSEGIPASRLPDFLGIDAVATFQLVGQDELAGEDLRATVAAQARHLPSGTDDATRASTERLLVAAARIGQHRFATDVLRNFGHSCGFCGMRPGPGLERRGLLVASHIKPWRSSSSRERLDVTNGIAACPTHDRAFDGGLLWVNGGYRIHLAEDVLLASRDDPGMDASFGHPPLAARLLVPVGSTPPDPRYLEWHARHVAAG